MKKINARRNLTDSSMRPIIFTYALTNVREALKIIITPDYIASYMYTRNLINHGNFSPSKSILFTVYLFCIPSDSVDSCPELVLESTSSD